MKSRVRFASIAVAWTALFMPGMAAQAQLEPPSTGGIVALQQELRMLGHNKRVLMIGAHPDDEDTELLTLLVRGMGAEAAYLSLNRGEGGQNLIGPELGEALGLIRTEELLAARKLDGARQFFTRAYDFGYSKSLEETWRFWPRDSVLEDVVRIVREFRPQIIVSVFSGTPRDGHGQHQAAGWVAHEVFRIAEDRSRFPGAGEPWRPLKLYRSTRFDSTATTLTLNGGVLDEAVGQSYRQIAMRGRSLHRSQDMGQLQRLGPSQIRLRLVEDRSGRPGPGLWDGIDTTLTATDPAVQRDQERHRVLARAIETGVVVDAVADDERIVPGQLVTVTATLWNTTSRTYWIDGQLAASDDLSFAGTVEERDSLLKLGPFELVTLTLPLRISETAAYSQPYFLRLPRIGGVYQWPPFANGDDWRGHPFELPRFAFQFSIHEGTPPSARDGVALTREVTFRSNNQAYGEIRRPLIVVPRIDVKLDPRTELWPLSPGEHHFTVTLVHGGKEPLRGSVALEVPAGWPSAEPQPFAFSKEDERESYQFSLRAPANLRPGSYEIRAVATDEQGRRYDQGVFTVDYPHIRPRSWTQPSTASINVAPLEMARLQRVGYIRGASDRVPEALASVGVPVVLLDQATLERGDLSSFDAIIVGSRAYETDSALTENNARVLAYARNGGLVIVQYQQQVFFNGDYAPLELKVGGEQIVLDTAGSTRAGPLIAHDRVTDETAPVRIIDPSSAVVNRPNRISPADWEGWVQERGLYFARSWDRAFKPVLEMADPGEAPLRGGLLVAKYGRGTYVYTGISFFRELPAGVPGAFRLFANLLALAESSVP